MSKLTTRTAIFLSLTLALLATWGLLRAAAPARGETSPDSIFWGVTMPAIPFHPGDTIEIGFSAGNAPSPFLSHTVYIEQDEEAPVLELISSTGGQGSTVTLRALRAGDAEVYVTGSFEKFSCTPPVPPPFPGPCYPNGYFFVSSPVQTVAVEPFGCGDANGDGAVNSLDAAWLLQYAAGLIETIVPPDNLDVNGDGAIDAVDATIILQHDAGLIPAPTCEA